MVEETGGTVVDEALPRLLNFIGGEWRAPHTGQYFPSQNPATGKTIHYIPDSGAVDIEDAVEAARRALPSWSESSRVYRSRLMNRLADLLEAHVAEFAEAESRDQGKTIKQALDLEIPRCVANIRYYAGLVLHFSEEGTAIDGIAHSSTRHEPIGIVGVISPWNLPLYLLTWKFAPAIAMGNCVIAKPSEMTSLTAYMLGRLINEAGFPPGVINFVFGYGAKAGQSLVEHPAVLAISFTGGTITGRKIATAAAIQGKKVSLELGGKNAAVVFADCDLDSTLDTCIRAAFANQGEICLCCSRIFVERSVYNQFISRFIQATSQLKVGDPCDADTFMGALVSEAHHQKICSYFDLARSEGLEPAFGGNSLKGKLCPKLAQGFFVEPTIYSNVKPSSRLMQEEIFGPIVCFYPFDAEEEVVGYVNGVEYGLAASVFSRDGQKAHRVARKIKSGVTWINCWMVRDLATPFGGVKASGYGREGGKYALQFFSDIKTITTAF